MHIRRLHVLIITIMLVLLGATSALAQTPSSGCIVSITVQTGATAAAGNLDLTLSGTFPGDPVALVLDQSGDLQANMTNTYNFNVPYSFCQLFQFKLAYDGTDQWLGESVSISVNGTDVWDDTTFGQGGALTQYNWRSGTWDGVQAYRSACQMTPVQLTFVTGTDGTNDSPNFYLKGNFSASPYLFIMDQPNDLQPNQTDTYNFLVPMGFCEMTGWSISKGISGTADDSWLAKEIDISIGNTTVFTNPSFYQVGPITVNSTDIGGTWNGTAAYQNQCAAALPPLELITPTPTLMVINGLQIIPTQTPQPILINPGTLHLIPTSTPATIHVLPGTIHAFPTSTIQPGAGLITACPGAPQQRLIVGGRGQVTPGGSNRLRDQPNTSGNLLTMIPPGGVFDVIGGPQCGEGYSWWQVRYNNIVGWTAEGTGSTYFIAPIQ